mgnify:CR=1 FL=1
MLHGQSAFNPPIMVLRFTTRGLVLGYYTEGIYLIPLSVLSVKHTSDSRADRGGTVVDVLSVDDRETMAVYTLDGQLVYHTSTPGIHSCSFAPAGAVVVQRQKGAQVKREVLMIIR